MAGERLSAAQYREIADAPKRHKYGAKAAFRCETCGAQARSKGLDCWHCGGRKQIRFASKAEARRYDVLRYEVERGAISDLCLQVPLALKVGAIELGHYVADFVYHDPRYGLVYEDVKGVDTPLSAWKRRHARAQYGIQIEIIR